MPWDPTAATQTLVEWWDARALGYSDGASATTITGLHAHDLLGVTPIFHTGAGGSGINGQATILFNGTSDYASGSDGSLANFDVANPFSLVILFRAPSVAAGGVLFSKRKHVAGFMGWEVQLTGGVTFTFMGTAFSYLSVVAITTTPADHVPSLVIITYDGSGLAAGVRIYINGVAQTLSVVSDTLSGSATNGAAAPTIGAAADGTLNFGGDLPQNLIYSGVLNGTDVANFSTYFAPYLPAVSSAAGAASLLSCV